MFREPNIFLSIVIPTKNSAPFLKVILPSILKQSASDSIEIIIVDNFSDDNTQSYAKSLGCLIVNVQGKAPQGCRQRNEGIKIAKGQYVLVLDHDMELASNFSEAVHQQLILSGDILAWYVPEKVLCQSHLLTQIRNFENVVFAETPIAATRLFHKSVFSQIGYYDDELSDGPGDWDFDMKVHRANIKTGSTNGHVIHHEEGLTLGRYIGKKYGYVAGSVRYKEKWQTIPDMQPRLLRQFSPLYRIFGFIDSKKKLFYVITHPVQYLLFTLVTLAKAVQYIRYKLSL